METLIDGLTIEQLMNRYGLNSETQFYKRRDSLGLKFDTPFGGRRQIATREQIAKLDELHEFIKQGGSIKQFCEMKKQQNRSGESFSESSDLSTELNGELSSVELYRDLALQGMSMLSKAVLRLPSPDPLTPQKQLQQIADQDWIVSTSQLIEILGVKEFGSERFGFEFVKVGKVGRQCGWKINKKNLEQHA